MNTRSIISALAVLALAVDAGQDRLVEPPKEEVWKPAPYIPPSQRGWRHYDNSPPLGSHLSAPKETIAAPIRLPLPGGGEAAARRMYEARKANMIMVGDLFIEELDFQIIDGQVVTVRKPGGSRFTIGQHSGGGVYLIKGNEMAVDMGDPNLPEGSIGAGYLLDAGLFTYTTVLGAGRQLTKAKLTEPRPATYEEFRQAVRDGYAFKTTVARKYTCSACKGTRVQEDGNQKHLCKTCAGQGQKQVTVAAVMVAGPVPVTGSR